MGREIESRQGIGLRQLRVNLKKPVAIAVSIMVLPGRAKFCRSGNIISKLFKEGPTIIHNIKINANYHKLKF
jgi:hypothetical protein